MLWSLSGIDGFVHGIHREPNRLRVVGQSLSKPDPGPEGQGQVFRFEYEVYTFDLPSRMLRWRAPGPPEEVQKWFRAVTLSSEDGGGFATLELDDASKRWVELELRDQELVVATDGPSPDELPRVVARLKGATMARARVHGDFVTLTDDQGRVVVLDRATLAPVSTFFV